MNPLIQAIAWTVVNAIAVGLSVALATIYILDWRHGGLGDSKLIRMTKETHLWDQAERIGVRFFLMILSIYAVYSTATLAAADPEIELPQLTIISMIFIRMGYTLLCVLLIFGDIRRLRERTEWEDEVYRGVDLPPTTTNSPPEPPVATGLG